MRFLKTSFVCGIAALFAAFFPPTALAAGSHPEVLVVYNSNSADSLAVANHYMSQRNIPPSNLCVITPPSTDGLTLSDYTTYVKTPIQSCLNALGSKSILYIVMTYMTPFAVGDGPMGSAALDSYLADIWDKYASQPFILIPSLPQPYYADSQSQGNVYLPFQSFAVYRANARNPLIYSVWRLDAPSPAIAMALVDNAIYAEQNGVSGTACIDETYDPSNSPIEPDAGTPSGNWDLYKAAQFLNAAGLTVTTDTLSTEFGTAPSQLTCPLTGFTSFYSGWYTLDNYNNAFMWQQGSIGWHLDSASALTPRSGPSWAPNALANGITVTSGSVTEPYLEGLVRPGGTFRNLLEGASVGDAFLRNTRWLKWETMYIGDPLYKPFGAGLSPFSPLQPVNSFTLSPQEIVSGTNSTGTITLSAAAPTAGTNFSLNAPAGISVPASVTVLGGATKASFPVTTAAATVSQFNIITATSGALTLQNTIITDPLIGTLVPSNNTTMAGYPVTISAILNGRAPTGGATLSLFSDNAAVTVPATVTVPAGSTVATFMAASTPVSSAVTANITAVYAGFGTGLDCSGSPCGITVVPSIAAVSATPSTINAGDSTMVAINLGTDVPAGYTATIQFTSSDPVSLPVPATITVPAGSHYGNFLATAAASGKTVVITATFGGSTATAMVTIN